MRALIYSVSACIIIFLTLAAAGTEIPRSTEEMAIREILGQVENLRYEGKYAEGIDLVNSVRERSDKLNQPELAVEVHYQLSLLYYHQQKYSLARAEMEMGLARARVHGLDHLEADFLAAGGVLEWKQGNLHLALPKLQQAMVIRESRKDYISMASISNNIGIIYFTLKNYEDAEFYYRKALELLENEDNERLRGSLYSNLAEVLIPMDRLEEAEGYLDRALEIELGTSDPHSLAYTYYNLGELVSRKGDSDMAIDYYGKAMELQTRIGDKWAMSLTHLKTAEEFLKNGQTKSSLKEAKIGYKLAQDLNALSLLRDYSDIFIRVYDQLGEEGRAQFFTDQYDWLASRVNLQEPPPAVEPPAASVAGIGDQKSSLSPIQTVIIFILAAMIIILILENSRLRNRMSNL